MFVFFFLNSLIEIDFWNDVNSICNYFLSNNNNSYFYFYFRNRG